VLSYVFPALCLALSCLLPLHQEASPPVGTNAWPALPGCSCLEQISHGSESDKRLPVRLDEADRGRDAFTLFDDCSPADQPIPLDGLHVVTLSDLRIPDPALKEMRTAQKFLAKSKIYRALYHLKRAIKLAPDCAQAHNSLGVVYFKGGHTREAEKSFERAAELGPGSPSSQTNLGLLYLATDRPADAIYPLEKASMLLPHDAASATRLAEAFFRSGRLAEAEQWSLRALEFEPGMHRTVHLLCCIYARQMKYQEAIHLLRDYLDGRRPGADSGQLQKLMSELEELVD
jgi:Flp pilus assembly protein TadD